jgi:PleD family two-component response regulator
MKLINDKKYRGILVVDNDKRIVALLKEILHEADYKNVFMLLQIFRFVVSECR